MHFQRELQQQFIGLNHVSFKRDELPRVGSESSKIRRILTEIGSWKLYLYENFWETAQNHLTAVSTENDQNKHVWCSFSDISYNLVSLLASKLNDSQFCGSTAFNQINIKCGSAGHAKDANVNGMIALNFNFWFCLELLKCAGVESLWR